MNKLCKIIIWSILKKFRVSERFFLIQVTFGWKLRIQNDKKYRPFVFVNNNMQVFDQMESRQIQPIMRTEWGLLVSCIGRSVALWSSTVSFTTKTTIRTAALCARRGDDLVKSVFASIRSSMALALLCCWICLCASTIQITQLERRSMSVFHSISLFLYLAL